MLVLLLYKLSAVLIAISSVGEVNVIHDFAKLHLTGFKPLVAACFSLLYDRIVILFDLLAAESHMA